MKYSDVRFFLSAPRIDRFLSATGSKTKAIRLYKSNLRVSQSLHPLISITEVVLRNKLNTILSAHFSDPDWIIHQKSGFMIDPSLRYRHKRTGQIKTNHYLKKEIEKAERRLRKQQVIITSGKVIAEQTLGFWTNLFEVHHYRLLSGTPIQIFNTLPSGYGRKEILEDLNSIRQFRNRINHNEPICFVGNSVDFTKTEEVYNSIKEILKWIDPKLENWIKDMDRVEQKIINAKKI
ncbi:MAG: Abi family protein [Allomuricauda sp.]